MLDKHADSHLAPAGRRQGSVDDLEPVGIAEAPYLNNPVARLIHRQISLQLMIQRTSRKIVPRLLCRLASHLSGMDTPG
jgi:hypothetical protein